MEGAPEEGEGIPEASPAWHTDGSTRRMIDSEERQRTSKNIRALFTKVVRTVVVNETVTECIGKRLGSLDDARRPHSVTRTTWETKKREGRRGSVEISQRGEDRQVRRGEPSHAGLACGLFSSSSLFLLLCLLLCDDDCAQI
jgi:hypothetical protein